MRLAGAARAGYALLVVGALIVPALAFDAAAARGGSARVAGLDLLAVGLAVGLLYAAYVARLLRRPAAGRGADLWLSAVHGLVVLAVAASGLPALALLATVRLHARIVDAEWPLLVGWAAVLGTAVALGEGTRRLSLRWLSRPQQD